MQRASLSRLPPQNIRRPGFPPRCALARIHVEASLHHKHLTWLVEVSIATQLSGARATSLSGCILLVWLRLMCTDTFVVTALPFFSLVDGAACARHMLGCGVVRHSPLVWWRMKLFFQAAEAQRWCGQVWRFSGPPTLGNKLKKKTSDAFTFHSLGRFVECQSFSHRQS